MVYGIVIIGGGIVGLATYSIKTEGIQRRLKNCPG